MASENSDASTTPNVVCRVQMWLDSRSNLTTVKESLSDPAIQFLDLYVRESFLSAFTLDQIQEVMKTIGGLPGLERLDISSPYTSSLPSDNDTSTQAYLPVSAIQSALTQQLTHLLLVNVKLGGSHSDFEAFASETQKLPKLHCVVLAEIRLQKQREKSYSLVDPFLRSLTRMPSLGHILISGSEDLGVLQASTLKMCMHTLRDLCLSQLSLSTPHLQAMAQNQLSNLRELDLQCHLTVDGARALAQMLQNNKTLEELTVRLTCCPETYSATPRTAAARAVMNMDAAMLEDVTEEENSSVDDDEEDDTASVIELDPRQCAEYKRNVILAAGIVRSRRLNSFELESADLSTPTLLEPFRLMLRDNYSLDTVRLHCSVHKGYCLENEIGFYTRLNNLGRSHLFQCPHCSHCDESYLSMLATLKEDLSAFYYFLRCKPSLMGSGGCHCSTPASAPRRALGKRKRLYRAVKYNPISYKS